MSGEDEARQERQSDRDRVKREQEKRGKDAEQERPN